MSGDAPVTPIAVLFDIDGTLITTGGAGARAWRVAFRRNFDVDVDITKLSEVGQTDPEVARGSFERTFGRPPEPRELNALMAGYVDALPDEVERSAGYRVMPGVRELLPRIRDAGLLLGLTTGNLEAAAHIKIERAGLDRFFCFGGYGSDSNDRTRLTERAIQRAATLHGREIAPASVEVVGDTPRDVEAAHGAGAVSIAVATGEYPIDALRAAGADHALPDLTAPFPGI